MRVKLSDLTKFSKGVQINGDNLIDDGQYIYLNGGINPSGRWNEANVDGNTITISEGGNSSGYVNYLTEPFWCGAHCYYLYDGPKNTKYFYYALKSQQDRLFRMRSGACMPNIKKSDLGKFEFEYSSDETKQNEVVSILSMIEAIIDKRKKELVLLDNLIKARFVEMFGDLKANNKDWPVMSFCDFAIIDTNMIHDFEGYEDYPHIGIDSIEKDTGNISGYRTVRDDGVISGKYVFTPEHIIYSKIRPNLNKVALPDFEGVCSADAYPIKPVAKKSNRVFLANMLRSPVF